MQRGYAACAALPLNARRSACSGRSWCIPPKPETLIRRRWSLFNQLAGDLAFGITALRTRLEEERMEKELRLLSAHVLEVQDLERRHLARELHDTTAQHLAALTLNLANLKGLSAQARNASLALCRDSIQLADQAAQEIRTQSYLSIPRSWRPWGSRARWRITHRALTPAAASRSR